MVNRERRHLWSVPAPSSAEEDPVSQDPESQDPVSQDPEDPDPPDEDFRVLLW